MMSSRGLCLFFHLVVIAMVLCLDCHAQTGSGAAPLVHDSVVFVEGADSACAGTVLTKDGAILTSFTRLVLDTGLTVWAAVDFGGGRVELTEIREVKLTKVHRSYDLALLQARAPAGGSFIPAVMATSRPVPGTDCRVQGNPGKPYVAASKARVTKGLVTFERHKVDALEHLQISADLTKSDAGGPVCDDLGRLFGIATWKVTDPAGIGYVIPAQGLDLSAFVEPDKRPTDYQLGRRYEDLAARNYRVLEMLQGEERFQVLRENLELTRLVAMAWPRKASPRFNMGKLSGELGNQALAARYYEASLAVEPDYPKSAHMLGVMLITKDPGARPRVVEMWLRGAASKEAGLDTSTCAENVSIASIHAQQYVAAGYMLRWADELFSEPGSSVARKRQEMWQILQQSLTPDEFALIRGAVGPFTAEMFHRLAKGEPATVIRTATATQSSVADGAKGTDAFYLPTAQQMEQLVRETSVRFLPKKRALPADGLTVPLPDTPADALLGSAGWHLILPFPNLSKIGVFNLATAKMDGYIEFSEAQIMCAAGGSVLAVLLPASQTLETYDLNTLEKTSSQKLQFMYPPYSISMGLYNARQVVMFCPEPPVGDAIPKFVPATVLLPDARVSYPTLKPIAGYKSYFPGDHRSRLKTAADEVGASYAVMLKKQSSGIGAFVLRTDGSISVDCNEQLSVDQSQQQFQPSHFGSAIVERRRLLLPGGPAEGLPGLAEPLPKDVGQNAILAPIAGYAGYVARSLKQVAPGKEVPCYLVCGLPGRNRIAEIVLHNQKPNGALDSNTLLYARLLASGPADCIIEINEKANFLRLVGLGLGAANSDVARPGAFFRRKMELPAGAEVLLESGPKGMVLDAASQTLVWEVPASQPGGQQIQAILVVKTPDGKKAYRIEKVTVP